MKKEISVYAGNEYIHSAFCINDFCIHEFKQLWTKDIQKSNCIFRSHEQTIPCRDSLRNTAQQPFLSLALHRTGAVSNMRTYNALEAVRAPCKHCAIL
jgi:hypothetical protein